MNCGSCPNNNKINSEGVFVQEETNYKFRMEVVGLACMRGMDLHSIVVPDRKSEAIISKYCSLTDFWHLLEIRVQNSIFH
jgi:hypothetical protein